MTPERQKHVGGKLVEEFYWNGKMVVYVDHCLTDEKFDSIKEPK